MPPAKRIDQAGLDGAGGDAEGLAQGGDGLGERQPFQGVAGGMRGPLLGKERCQGRDGLDAPDHSEPLAGGAFGRGAGGGPEHGNEVLFLVGPDT